jgi:predicted NBD/HSP70 family sugar kinase
MTPPTTDGLITAAAEGLREAQAATDKVGDLLAQATAQLEDLLGGPETSGSDE